MTNRDIGQLTITRRPGEKIWIGDNVTVEVSEVSGSHVRLRVRAPKSVTVDRTEARWRARLSATLLQEELLAALRTSTSLEGLLARLRNLGLDAARINRQDHLTVDIPNDDPVFIGPMEGKAGWELLFPDGMLGAAAGARRLAIELRGEQ